MGVTVAAIRVACNTSTGTQTITTSDLDGLTPKAAYFIATYATVDGTAAPNQMLGLGATDGTRQWSVALSGQDGSDPMAVFSNDSSAACLRILNPADGTDDGVAAFSAWVTNGITINWTDAPSAGFLLTVILFAGSDLSAYADNFTVPNTAGGTVDVTAIGFAPNVVLGAYVASATAWFSHGFVTNDGTTTIQRCISTVTRPTASAQNVIHLRSDAIVQETAAGGSSTWRGSLGSFDSSGFTFTTVSSTSGWTQKPFYYLALSLGGAVAANLVDVSTPTSTGSVGYTSPGFEPQFILQLASTGSGDGVANASTLAYTQGYNVITPTVQYANTVSDQDAAAANNSQSLSDNQAVNLPDIDGTVIVAGTLTSMDATGFTVNYTTANATARLWPTLAIEAGETATTHDLIANDLTAGTPTLGTPTLTQVHGLTASTLTSGAPTLGEPSITQAHALVASDLTSGAPTLGEPSIGQAHVIVAADLVAGTPTLGTPALSQVHSLTADDLTSGAPVLGNPSMGGVVALTANDLTAGAPVLGNPALSTELVARGILTGAPTLGNPSLAQVHVLTADNLTTAAPDLGTPTIGAIHNLEAATLTTAAPTLGTPAISQVHVLIANGLTSGAPVLSSPALGTLDIHDLIAVNLVTGAPVLGEPVLTVISETYVPPPSNRIYAIPRETRVLSIPHEDRVFAI